MTEAPYGSWASSPVDTTMMTAGNCHRLGEMILDQTDFGVGHVYWTEARFDGRRVICSLNTEQQPNTVIEWTPFPFSAANAGKFIPD